MQVSCVNHPDHSAAILCTVCKRPFCDQCLVHLETGALCKACMAAIVRGRPRPAGGFMRLVLSVVPGAGHMYLGLMQRGLQLMVLTMLGSVIIGSLFGGIVALFIVIPVFFSIFDAREAHLRLARSLEVPDLILVDWRAGWNTRWLAYGLIAAGAVALYNTLLHDFLRMLLPSFQQYRYLAGTIRGTTLGLLTLGAGLWLLRSQARKGDQT